MITCYLRYVVDPFKLKEFEAYGKMWIPLVEKFGGKHHGYFMPSAQAVNSCSVNSASPMRCTHPFRFVTYAVELSAIARDYLDTLQGLPAMQEWLVAAKAETEVMEQYEQYRVRA